MNRTVKAAGAVVTVVAVAVLLALLYLQPGGSSPTTARSSAAAESASAASSLPSTDGLRWVRLSALPIEARQTVDLIDAGGPFPYPKDGSVFNNFEGKLAKRSKGYYREYTVPTPGERDRGARRIVTGDRDRDLFYTGDHYESFVRVQR